MSVTSSDQPLDFAYLADSPEFAELSRLTFALTGLCVVLVDPPYKRNKTVTRRRESPLCRLIQGHPEGGVRCKRCDQRNLMRAAKGGRAVCYPCHAGLIDLAIPIFAEGRHVATISSGQILPAPHSEAGFQNFCRRNPYLKLPRRTLRQAYYRAPYMERRRIRAALRLLTYFAEHLCRVGLRIRELSRRSERPEMHAAKQYVCARLRESLSLAEVAAHVHLSPSYFSDLFHRSEGVNFVAYVQQQRIREACAQLESTRSTITEIAFGCGFNNLTHFNRVFRKFQDCSPRQYRQRIPSALRISATTRS